jgi:multiple sugar transport system permease protein
MPSEPYEHKTLLRATTQRERWGLMRELATYVPLTVGCALAVAPILWAVVTSLKTNLSIYVYPPQWLPNPLSLEHYTLLFKMPSFARFFLNSIVLSLGTILLSLIAAAPAAYAAARLRFRCKEGILLTFLATSMIPGISILVPIYIVAIRSQLLNNYFFLILVYSAWMIPQSIWFIKAFIEVVPRDIEEAALLDGCSVIGAFCRIVLPLIQPGLAAVSILSFIFVWNDFLIGVMLTTREEMRTVQVGLVRFIQEPTGVSWGQFMAFGVLAIAPVLVAFFLLQKRFIEGLTSGGIKG